MFTTPPLRGRSFFSVLVDLVGFHPAVARERSRSRAAQRHGEEALDRMPAHLLNDIGLLYDDDGCLTNRGALEFATRVRRSWS